MAYNVDVIVLYVQNTTNGFDIATTYMLGENVQTSQSSKGSHLK